MREGRLEPELHLMPLNITEVNISPDLRMVNCFFVPFNTQLSVEQLLNALERSKYIIRNSVTKNINLKYSPEIFFYFDQSIDNVMEIEGLLKK